jgi:hypothetical protein
LSGCSVEHVESFVSPTDNSLGYQVPHCVDDAARPGRQNEREVFTRLLDSLNEKGELRLTIPMAYIEAR